jgi:hypothetical protein
VWWEQVGIWKQMTKEKVENEVQERVVGKSSQINSDSFFAFIFWV